MTVVLPATALGGANPAIFGSTLKLPALAPVPMGLVMLTGPVNAPAGTTARKDVGVTAVAVTVTGPVNVTSVAPVRFVPVIITVVPTVAAAGVNAVARGG